MSGESSAVLENQETTAETQMETAETLEERPAGDEAETTAATEQTPEEQPVTGDGQAETPAPDGETPEPAGNSEIDELRRELAELRSVIDPIRQQLAYREEFEADILVQSQTVEKLAAEVVRAEGAVELAKGELKAKKESYEASVNELREMIRDRESGQRRFAFGSGNQVAPVASQVPPVSDSGSAKSIQSEPATATETPRPAEPLVDEHADDSIDFLGAKAIKTLIGADEFQRQKDREEPVGLSEKELDKLVAIDLTTIGKLEQAMRDDPWWHQKISGFGEKKVGKLIETLRVFRARYPQPVADDDPTAEVDQAEAAAGQDEAQGTTAEASTESQDSSSAAETEVAEATTEVETVEAAGEFVAGVMREGFEAANRELIVEGTGISDEQAESDSWGRSTVSEEIAAAIEGADPAKSNVEMAIESAEMLVDMTYEIPAEHESAAKEIREKTQPIIQWMKEKDSYTADQYRTLSTMWDQAKALLP